MASRTIPAPESQLFVTTSSDGSVHSTIASVGPSSNSANSHALPPEFLTVTTNRADGGIYGDIKPTILSYDPLRAPIVSPSVIAAALTVGPPPTVKQEQKTGGKKGKGGKKKGKGKKKKGAVSSPQSVQSILLRLRFLFVRRCHLYSWQPHAFLTKLFQSYIDGSKHIQKVPSGCLCLSVRSLYYHRHCRNWTRRISFIPFHTPATVP